MNHSTLVPHSISPNMRDRQRRSKRADMVVDTVPKTDSHAFVWMVWEALLRLTVQSFAFGDASCHATLSSHHAVLAAGEVEVGEDGVVPRWKNKSGTFQPKANTMNQAGLPVDTLCLYTPRNTGPRSCSTDEFISHTPCIP